jgi:hypothetical protein
VTSLPPDVLDRYWQLAVHRNWPPATLEVVLRSAEWYRALDEGPAHRGYFERTDAEGSARPGTRWMWETVLVTGEVIAVKQIQVPAAGAVRRYCWQSLEDDTGTLTDQPLNPEEEELTPISRREFYQLWGPPFS